MKRRDLLRAGGIGAVGLLAGCSGLGSSGGCGPGEDRISALLNVVASRPTGTARDGGPRQARVRRIEGRVESVTDDGVVVSDGTGTAQLTAFSGEFGREVESGDCVSAVGVPVATEDPDVDVGFLVTGGTEGA